MASCQCATRDNGLEPFVLCIREMTTSLMHARIKDQSPLPQTYQPLSISPIACALSFDLTVHQLFELLIEHVHPPFDVHIASWYCGGALSQYDASRGKNIAMPRPKRALPSTFSYAGHDATACRLTPTDRIIVDATESRSCQR